MTFLIFQLNLNVCPLTSSPVTQNCLTVAKCVLMTATFSGVYFKERASTMSSAAPNSRHRAPSVCTNWFPEGAFNEPGVRCVLYFLWHIFPLFWRQQSSYRLLTWGLDGLAPETRRLEAARLPKAVVNVLRIC